MNWKKNAFSYILWLTYAVMVGAGMLCISSAIGRRMSVKQEFCVAMTVVFLLLCGLLVFGLQKFVKHCQLSVMAMGNLVPKVIEALLFVCLIAVGIYLRIDGLVGHKELSGGMVYYETAMVEAGKSIPQIVHGATYLYLNLLRSVFFFGGNKIEIAAVVQIILQLLAGVMLYFCVRKLSGAFAGIFTTAYFMLSPYIIKDAYALSPDYLFLLFYTVVLFLIALVLPKNNKAPFGYIVIGLMIGLIIYLDIFGVTLLLFLAGVFWVERKEHERFLNSRIAVFLFGILGALVGFLGAISIDAVVSKKAFFNVLVAWAEIYYPQNITLIKITDDSTLLAEVVILFGFLALGIFTFWCNRELERQGIWTLVVAALFFLRIMQMTHQNIGCNSYLVLFGAVLGGIAIESIFLFDSVREESELSEEVTDACKVLEMENLEEEKTSETQESAQPQVQFFENPLPLPKKHEPKVMDFKLTEEQKENDFDFEVADDDDFDI